MIDHEQALAFEIAAAKGVYALLLGSGVSRSANIPTGWDITLELVRRVAALRSEDAGSDPAAWYEGAFGVAPNYSDLLDRLASTASLRQQVIRPFIEPTEEQRQQGQRLPTEAHKAVAKLIARGYIKIVITTNFDRLLEQALAEQGVEATVISSDDHVAGSLPLVHAGPVVVKLHGDYLDTRIRNTLGELASYSPAMEALLARVLDEFGLVVCGWSADWDEALRSSIDRAPNRRFPMYWASRGEPSEAAKGLIARRGARQIAIGGADGFFATLSDRVETIRRMNEPHPLSVDLAVAMMKEYLADPRQRIRLSDLIDEELKRMLVRLDGPGFDTNTWSEPIFATQVSKYRAATATLVPMAYTAGLWSTEEQGDRWIDVVKLLASRIRNASGQTYLVNLRGLPAALILYAFVLGAVFGKRPESLGAMVGSIMDFGNISGELALGDRLNIGVLMTANGDEAFKSLLEYKTKLHPGSELVADILRPVAAGQLQTHEQFDEAFARVELVLALGYAERIASKEPDRFWAPVGRASFSSSRQPILKSWRADFTARAFDSDVCVMGGLLTVPRFDEIEDLASRSRFGR